MARPPRIEFPGALYHVIVRGNRKQDIFLDDSDRRDFIDRVRRYKEKCGFVLYAYVLMTNHVHLLIETRKTPLSKIMQLINFTYTQRFNKRHEKVGHLFQGRYKALLCDRDEYLLQLVRYIHLNPVRANLAAQPQDYKWSSHNEYLGKGLGIADAQMVLGIFSENVSEARGLYGKFVEDTVGAGRDESFYKAVGQQIIGNDGFAERVLIEAAQVDKLVRRPSLPQLFSAVSELTGVSPEEIKSRSRGREIIFARGLFVSACREFGYKLSDLEKELGRDLSVLSRLTREAECPEGRKAMEKLKRMLNA